MDDRTLESYGTTGTLKWHKMPALPEVLMPFLAADPRDEQFEQFILAADLLREHHGSIVDRVIRIRRDPREVVVLYINGHHEPRTAFITADGPAITINVVTGFA